MQTTQPCGREIVITFNSALHKLLLQWLRFQKLKYLHEFMRINLRNNFLTDDPLLALQLHFRACGRRFHPKWLTTFIHTPMVESTMKVPCSGTPWHSPGIKLATFWLPVNPLYLLCSWPPQIEYIRNCKCLALVSMKILSIPTAICCYFSLIWQISVSRFG